MKKDFNPVVQPSQFFDVNGVMSVLSKRTVIFKNLLFVFLFLSLASPVFSQSIEESKLERAETVLIGNDVISAVHVEDSTLFVASYSNGLFLFDISKPFEPRSLGRTTELDIPTNGVVKKGNYLMIGDNVDGVLVYDITSPEEIKLVTKLKTESGEAWDILADKEKNTLYVATGKIGLEIWDISDPANGKLISKLDDIQWDYAWGLALDEEKNRLFVSDKANGVKIFDVSKPTKPAIVNSYKTSAQNHFALPYDTLLFLANGPGGFEVLSINNIQKPKTLFKDTYSAPFVTGITLYKKNSNFLFIGTGRSGLVVYHIPSILKGSTNPVVKADKISSDYGRITQYEHGFYVATNKGVLIYNFDLAPYFTDVTNQVIDENQTLNYSFKGVDPDGSPISISLIPLDKMPDSLQYDKETSNIVWKPSYEESGVYDFRVRINELTPDNMFAEAPFKIEVKHVNRAPSLPELKDLLVDEDKKLEYQIPEGSDPDREDEGKLTYVAKNLPFGAVFDDKTRQFTWVPSFSQSGQYVVTIFVKDSNSDGNGILTDSKDLTIRVDNVNRKPTFTRMDRQIFNENSESSFTISAEDPDTEDKGKLTYSAGKLPDGASFDPDTQTFSWMPTYEQAGDYTVIFSVQDQGLNSLLFPNPGFVYMDTMAVNITVKQTNRSPHFVQVEPKEVNENQSLSFKVEANDPDREDIGKLVFSASSLPEGAIFDPKTQTFSWKPTYEQSGNYTVAFSTIDSGIDGMKLSDQMRVSINVPNANRPPVFTQPADMQGQEVTPLSFSLTVSDPDREDTGKLKITSRSLPEGATLAGNIVSWTPTYEQAGKYKVGYVVTDFEGLVDSVSHYITITQKNRAPKFVALNTQSGKENDLLTFSVSANDPDKEDLNMLKYAAEDLPQGASFNPKTQTFSWKPTYEQSGNYAVKFIVTDKGIDGNVLSDNMTVPVTIQHVNRAPQIYQFKDTTINEDSEMRYFVGVFDPDVEDDGKLTVTAKSIPEGAILSGQNFTWKPTYEQSGKYTLVFQVADLGGLTATTTNTIVVKNVNRSPEIEIPGGIVKEEEEEIVYKVKARDPDKEDEGKLKVEASGVPKGAVFKGGELRWKPTYEQSGVYTISYTVTDKEGLKDTKSHTITVQNKNRAPEVTVVEKVEGKEEEALGFSVKVSDPDKEDEGQLKVTTMGLPEGSVYEKGKFSWKPTYEQSGVYNISFTVTDNGALSDKKTVVVTIANKNRKPELEVPAEVEAKENEGISLEIKASDPDKEDEGQLKVTAMGLPEGSSLSNGKFSWQPTYEQSGVYKIIYTVTDKEGLKDTKGETIVVKNVNRSPEIEIPGGIVKEEEEEIVYKVKARDPDKEDEGKLKVEASGVPKGAVFKGGEFRWKPTYEQSGVYTISYTVTDKEGLKDTKSHTITINDKNRMPTIKLSVGKFVSAMENEPLVISVAGADLDKEDKQLMLSAESLPSGAMFDSNMGKFSWTPTEGQAGAYTVIFKVQDTKGGEAVSSVSITVAKAKPQKK
ncbi:Ig family protein [Chloroherpeton thalassium ATCC 35110]|uniref:Ig family protein n=1 Tax=Chloroherpeton thalassium (strain ATCC 35110 / GB-78) TaxID=517418 RepID=B3QUB4_CHLT3|nr:putative Ig domain-containing protein [Chloroherpeton thalassium]ACF14363.1 Ig family protein [Chloroherpeton thalassium ATCC 35110]